MSGWVVTILTYVSAPSEGGREGDAWAWWCSVLGVAQYSIGA